MHSAFLLCPLSAQIDVYNFISIPVISEVAAPFLGFIRLVIPGPPQPSFLISWRDHLGYLAILISFHFVLLSLVPVSLACMHGPVEPGDGVPAVSLFARLVESSADLALV